MNDVPDTITTASSAIDCPPTPIQSEPAATVTVPPGGVRRRGWVLRVFSWIGRLCSQLFGIASVIFLLAVAANIPLLQFLSFGYLLEVTGRLSRGGKIRSAFIGLNKAARIGSAVLGAWLLLIPLRFASQFWLEAYLIDPASQQTHVLRVVQIVLILLTVAHIGAAWFCGGKLRYFFWPIAAPFYFAVGDWFLPAILWKKIRKGGAFKAARENVWDFFGELNLPYYFWLGLKGFIGTGLWLFVPTLLLVSSTQLDGPMAIVTGLLGGLFAIPIFSILPFVQAHFAVDGQMIRFLEIRTVIANMGRSPFAHILALLLTLLFAVPLFLLKVEQIPPELLWTLSIVFIALTWPSKIVIGWAYRRGTRRERAHRWWIRYPVFMLAAPISFSFVFVLFFTRYVTWNGAWSLVENHVFLLPAPFWLSVFQ